MFKLFKSSLYVFLSLVFSSNLLAVQCQRCSSEFEGYSLVDVPKYCRFVVGCKTFECKNVCLSCMIVFLILKPLAPRRSADPFFGLKFKLKPRKFLSEEQVRLELENCSDDPKKIVVLSIQAHELLALPDDFELGQIKFIVLTTIVEPEDLLLEAKVRQIISRKRDLSFIYKIKSDGVKSKEDTTVFVKPFADGLRFDSLTDFYPLQTHEPIFAKPLAVDDLESCPPLTRTGTEVAPREDTDCSVPVRTGAFSRVNADATMVCSRAGDGDGEGCISCGS